jgi:hypothetical protein
MLNIFRKYRELEEIRLGLPEIESRLERIEWILHDIQVELDHINDQKGEE